MATRVVMHPDHQAVVERHPGVIRELRRRGRKVVHHAIRISNVGKDVYIDKEGHIHPGRYQGSWRFNLAYRASGRPFVRVHNPVVYSVYLEFGTRRMKAYRVLRRARSSARR